MVVTTLSCILKYMVKLQLKNRVWIKKKKTPDPFSYLMGFIIMLLHVFTRRQGFVSGVTTVKLFTLPHHDAQPSQLTFAPPTGQRGDAAGGSDDQEDDDGGGATHRPLQASRGELHAGTSKNHPRHLLAHASTPKTSTSDERLSGSLRSSNLLDKQMEDYIFFNIVSMMGLSMDLSNT